MMVIVIVVLITLIELVSSNLNKTFTDNLIGYLTVRYSFSCKHYEGQFAGNAHIL
jgi:hypothetical protein